jgi:DNA-binding response OmpR family regulator
MSSSYTEPFVKASNAFSLIHPGEPLHLILLEDDEVLRDRILAPKLRQFGFEVTAVGRVTEMAAAIERGKPDIVLLDIGLPESDGFAVARWLRAEIPDIGIVMLTGRSENIDRIRGLSEGADAYLSKPAEIDVIVATLQSLARRLKIHPVQSAIMSSWRLDSDDWILLSPGNGRVTLSKTERCLLEKIMQHPNQVISREALISTLTDNVHDFDPHRLDSLIHRLRRKVLATLGESFPLDVIYGQGYLLAVS